MQRLRGAVRHCNFIRSIIIVVCVVVSFLLYVFFDRFELHLRMIIGQARHVPILVLYLINLADNRFGSRRIFRQLQVDQVPGVILVKSYLLENDELGSQVLQSLIDQVAEILRNGHALLRVC